MATQPIRATESRNNSEALSRATTGLSMSNYPTIYRGFTAKGIPDSEIKPRENVFTYNAWRALGRQVRRGEHGVKVLTFIDCQKRDEETGQLKERFRRPSSTTVFHVSQTDEIPGVRDEHPLVRVPTIPRRQVPTSSHRGFCRAGKTEENPSQIRRESVPLRVAFCRAAWRWQDDDGAGPRRDAIRRAPSHPFAAMPSLRRRGCLRQC